MFNEVFFDEVFVPDDCVIGGVNEGWGLARMTLANERVTMSTGSTFGIGVESLLRLASRRDEELTSSLATRLGRLLVEAQSLHLMAHRSTLLSLAGTDPGSGASLRKLLGAEHEQRVQELGLAMLGSEGAAFDGQAARWAQGFLAHALSDHRRRHERGAAQRDRRAHPRTAAGRGARTVGRRVVG